MSFLGNIFFPLKYVISKPWIICLVSYFKESRPVGISLAGGLPNPTTFPFTTLTAGLRAGPSSFLKGAGRTEGP